MSHFSKLELQFKDHESLIEAFQQIGYLPQVHTHPVNLYGYKGDKRPEVAQIVIPRSQIDPVSNDIGFYRDNEAAGYQCITSDVKTNQTGYG